jgi:hypothetical protein
MPVTSAAIPMASGGEGAGSGTPAHAVRTTHARVMAAPLDMDERVATRTRPGNVA